MTGSPRERRLLIAEASRSNTTASYPAAATLPRDLLPQAVHPACGFFYSQALLERDAHVFVVFP
jgi:hypothetical protein